MIYRQSGQTSAQAMRAISQRHGDDVIVLSTRETPEGVEVLFTLDERAARQAAARPPVWLSSQASAASAKPVSADAQPLVSSRVSDLGNWLHADPVRADLWHALSSAGLSAGLSQTVLQRLGTGLSPQQAATALVQTLYQQLTLTPAAGEWVDQPGAYALVGPTGSGKTTTLAKVAARCLAIHGKGSVALVTTDTYRIGAVDQLKIYGRVLGVNVHVAANQAALQAVMQANSQVRLLLVDTMGLSPRDDRMNAFIQTFDALGIRKVLVLNAASQTPVQHDAVRRFRGQGFAGCVLAKLDECLSLGGTLDLVLRESLPVLYTSAGQRVPEDLHRTDALFLLHHTLPALVERCGDLAGHLAHWRRIGLMPSQAAPSVPFMTSDEATL